jgi:hypothetical protein
MAGLKHLPNRSSSSDSRSSRRHNSSSGGVPLEADLNMKKWMIGSDGLCLVGFEV